MGLDTRITWVSSGWLMSWNGRIPLLPSLDGMMDIHDLFNVATNIRKSAQKWVVKGAQGIKWCGKIGGCRRHCLTSNREGLGTSL